MQSNRLLTFFLSLSFCALLASCGGGSGSSDDTSPDDFEFSDEYDVPLAEYVVSEEIEVSGINTETPISIEGGEYSINGTAFTDEEGEVVDGDVVFVRVTSADTLDTEVEATLYIGNKNDIFLARTTSTSLVIRDAFKALTFSWSSVEGASYYRLLEKATANAEFKQIAREFDSTAIGLSIEVPVHRLDWINAEYKLETCTNEECSTTDEASPYDYMRRTIGYVKASNTEEYDNFGTVALSADGATLAIGAPGEDGASIGINGDEGNNSMNGAGAVYVFVKEDNLWRYQAYIKASNPNESDAFGSSLALSGDGNTLVVSAPLEDSASSGIDGDQQNNASMDAGAVYVFRRAGDSWIQQNYIKAPQTTSGDKFGSSLALSSFGGTLVVSAIGEDSNAQLESNTSIDSGAVYLYSLFSDNWVYEQTFKAPNADSSDGFGSSIDISSNGKRLIVGAPYEASQSTGLNGNQEDNTLENAGAAYLFQRVDDQWLDAQYIKASNTRGNQEFASSVAISDDGSTIAIGATGEASISIGVNGDENDFSNPGSGAAYVFTEANGQWAQEAYIKSSNGDIDDFFGGAISLNAEGNLLAVGAVGESSEAEGVSGNEFNNVMLESGAVYVFEKNNDSWQQIKYVKSPNTDEGDLFGSHLQLDASGDNLAIGAPAEQGSSNLFENQQSSNSLVRAGAAYIY